MNRYVKNKPLKYSYLLLLSALGVWFSACSVYSPGSSGTAGSDASLDGGSAGTGGTGGSDKTDASRDNVTVNKCVANPSGGKSCPQMCPDVCDGKDNDCDGATDEEPQASQGCSFSHATAKCDKGACALDTCDEMFGDCDKDPSNGCETPLDMFTDCGKCGQSCADVKNASGAACESGACVFDKCRMGYGDCDGDKNNGCETALDEMDNCGACGKECSKKSCAGGVCTGVSCKEGLADCDGDADNACETSLTSVTNCVMCGNACSLENATASCKNGTCGFFQCKVGFGDCDNDTTNGCEQRLDDMDNCGACDVECEVTIGTGFCTGGSCTEVKCLPGKADCDGDNTSCEVSLDSADNCGFCGNNCGAVGGGDTTCKSGSCQLASCDPGTYDCDKDPLTGCESNLKDTENCGKCGTACSLPNADASCATGSCKLTQCSDGFGDCNGDVADGCETDLTSADHCGGCDKVCSAPLHATAGCNNGVCAVGSCDAGWGDCTADPGCETQLGNDANCKACGDTCSGRPNAASGTCTDASSGCSLTCNSGYGDCNNDSSDGCETGLNSVDNCGKCGGLCVFLQTCTAGKCCFLWGC